MKNFSTYFFAVAVGLASFSSCKKDDTTSPTPTPAATKTDLLTAKSWKMTELKVGGQSIYNSPLVQDCDKDDLLKFNTNKSATFSEGTLKCDPSSPQSRTGSWDLTTNETKLKVTDPDGEIVEGTINTLTSTTLTVTDPNVYGSSQPGEITYTAQ